MSFCDCHIAGMPKSAISIDFPRSCNLLFSKNTQFNSSIWISIESLLLVQEHSAEKNLLIFSLRQDPDRLVMQKKVPLVLENVYFQTFQLSINTPSISSIKVSMESFQIVAKHSVEKLSYINLASES